MNEIGLLGLNTSAVNRVLEGKQSIQIQTSIELKSILLLSMFILIAVLLAVIIGTAISGSI